MIISEDIFEQSKDTLKSTSLDDRDKNKQIYMVQEEYEVINFDTVKVLYCQRYTGLSKDEAKYASSSVDAMYETDGKIYFIEFKNGKLNTSDKRSKLKSKLRDSIQIYCDIQKKDLDFARLKTEYILVYNESENIGSINEVKGKIENKEEQSEKINTGLSTIQSMTSALAEEEFIHFGLEVLKGIFTSDVKTYNVEEFKEKFYPKFTK